MWDPISDDNPSSLDPSTANQTNHKNIKSELCHKNWIYKNYKISVDDQRTQLASYDLVIWLTPVRCFFFLKEKKKKDSLHPESQDWDNLKIGI